MKYFGEMLLGLKTDAGRNVNKWHLSRRQHPFGQRQALSRQMKMRWGAGGFLECTREVRLTHMHQRGEMLDLNVFGNMFGDVDVDARQFLLVKRYFGVARVSAAAVTIRDMQGNSVGEGLEAAGFRGGGLRAKSACRPPRARTDPKPETIVAAHGPPIRKPVATCF